MSKKISCKIIYHYQDHLLFKNFSKFNVKEYSPLCRNKRRLCP